MGRRTYMEHEKRTRRISRRVKNRLKLQEPVIFTLERDKKGKLGVKMDRDLNITKVEKFAAKCGASIGQKIIEFNGIPVVTKKDVLNAMKKTGGSKAKKCKLTIVFDPLAQTELRADELSQLSHIKVKVPLHVVPKIEMREYVQLNPSRPDRQQRNPRIQSAKRRNSISRFQPTKIQTLVLNMIAPPELEETRPVSPLKRDTPSKAHALHVRDMLFKDEKLDTHEPISVHESPLVDLDVPEVPSSPTRITSPSRGRGTRRDFLRSVERSAMSVSQSHDLFHDVERIGLEEDHIAHDSHDIDWPSREHRRVLRAEHTYRTKHSRSLDLETHVPIVHEYDDDDVRSASPKRTRGSPSYRFDRITPHDAETEAPVRHRYLEDARDHVVSSFHEPHDVDETLSQIHQQTFPLSTRSRRFRFESVEVPSRVKPIRMIGLESARDHVVTGEELREHSLSPKRRHIMPSSRAERRFSLSRENITRAANVRHRRIDDARDHVLGVEEVREHSVSPKHSPSLRGRRHFASSRREDITRAAEVRDHRLDDGSDLFDDIDHHKREPDVVPSPSPMKSRAIVKRVSRYEHVEVVSSRLLERRKNVLREIRVCRSSIEAMKSMLNMRISEEEEREYRVRGGDLSL